MEGVNFLATGKLVSLGKLQMFDCDYMYGGLESEKDYPYSGTDCGGCKFDKAKIIVSVSNYSIVPIDEYQITANLVSHSSPIVASNAVFMQMYIHGISCLYICSKSQDHGVLLVGYRSAGCAPIRFKEKPYWIIKNSYGENWGDHGSYKICEDTFSKLPDMKKCMIVTTTSFHCS